MSTELDTAHLCGNCRAPVPGLYCESCGQKRAARLTMGQWLHDFTMGVLNLDARFLRSIIDLTLRPGLVAREYVNGRRMPWYNPASFALVTCALWWFAVGLRPELPDTLSVRYGQFANLAAVPLLTLFAQPAFIGSRYNYAEQLAMMFFVTGQVFLWRAFLALLVLVDNPTINAQINNADSLLFYLYTAWAYWQFHRGLVRWLPLRILGGLAGITIASVVVNVGLIMLDRLAG